jgi:selenide,water dikinase
MGRNLDYFGRWVKFGPDVSQLMQDMLMTPETSGGLLVALPAEQVETFMAHCETAVPIGHVTAGEGFIHVTK